MEHKPLVRILIKPEHPGWCRKVCGPGGMRGVGQHVGQVLPELCVCPKTAAAGSILVPRGIAASAGGRADPAWLICYNKSFPVLFPPSSHVSSTCVIAICWGRVVLVPGCARSPRGRSQESGMSVILSAFARCCIWTAYKGLCELAGLCLRTVRGRQR